MKRRALFLLLFLTLIFGSLEALRLVYERAAIKRQPTLQEEVRAIEARYQSTPAKAGAFLFVGSSSIRRWSALEESMHPLAVLNHGFGGSELEDIIQHRKALIDEHAPGAVILYCGDNDLGPASPKTAIEVTQTYKRLVQGLEELDPRLRIFCLSIKPSPARLGRWPLMKSVNRSMRTWCEDRVQVTYLDVTEPLLDERNLPRPELYEEDGIHLNPSGYERWTTVIRPALEQLNFE